MSWETDSKMLDDGRFNGHVVKSLNQCSNIVLLVEPESASFQKFNGLCHPVLE